MAPTARIPACHPDRKHRSGGLCGPCYMARWKAANPGYQARWHAEHPGRSRRYYWNKLARDGEVAVEKNRTKSREWAAANRERSRAKALAWAKANPAKAYERSLRHLARKRGAAVNDFTAAQWAELLEEHDHQCCYCGASGVPLEREHMVPLARGGDNTKSNIVPACRDCNARKGTKTADEFQS